MKIVVVSKDDRKRDAVADVVRFYAGLEEAGIKKLGNKLAGQLAELSDGHSAEVIYIQSELDKTKLLTDRIKAENANLVVTYDLAGFEETTLTDGIAYNLLNVRQINFVHEGYEKSPVLIGKNISINMFWMLY